MWSPMDVQSKRKIEGGDWYEEVCGYCDSVDQMFCRILNPDNGRFEMGWYRFRDEDPTE